MTSSRLIVMKIIFPNNTKTPSLTLSASAFHALEIYQRFSLNGVITDELKRLFELFDKHQIDREYSIPLFKELLINGVETSNLTYLSLLFLNFTHYWTSNQNIGRWSDSVEFHLFRITMAINAESWVVLDNVSNFQRVYQDFYDDMLAVEDLHFNRIHALNAIQANPVIWNQPYNETARMEALDRLQALSEQYRAESWDLQSFGFVQHEQKQYREELLRKPHVSATELQVFLEILDFKPTRNLSFQKSLQNTLAKSFTFICNHSGFRKANLKDGAFELSTDMPHKQLEKLLSDLVGSLLLLTGVTKDKQYAQEKEEHLKDISLFLNQSQVMQSTEYFSTGTPKIVGELTIKKVQSSCVISISASLMKKVQKLYQTLRP